MAIYAHVKALFTLELVSILDRELVTNKEPWFKDCVGLFMK
jgi:hypothetical protein